MEELFIWLRMLHILCSAFAILGGSLSIINKKGSFFHRMTGLVFVYAVLIGSFLIIIMTFVPEHDNLLLLTIGIFSAYTSSSGYRSLFLKQAHPNVQPKKIDWVISGLTALFAIYILVQGVKVFFVTHSTPGLTVISIAITLGYLIYSDFKIFTQAPNTRHFWLFRHITRMICSVAGTYSGFLIVNSKFIRGAIDWYVPFVIGLLLIGGFRMYYKTKFQYGEKARDILILRIGQV